MTFISRIITTLTVMLLAACSSMPSKQLSPSEIAELDIWQAKGKLGVTDRGRSHSINFNWQNHRDDFDIQLYGALGAGRVSLKQQDGQIELRDGKEVRTANSPEELLEQSLGWQLPVHELIYWIKGQASPLSTKHKEILNDDGTLAKLNQSGWQLGYRYPEKGSKLPRKIVAQRAGLKLVIVIKSWQY